MPFYTFDGHAPVVHPSAWIAPTACLIGQVTVEADASVWFNAVLRADSGPIRVGAGANVQDGSVLHGGAEETWIGPGATVGHCCVVHSARIGREALIGNNATVLDGAEVGERAMVAANSVVSPGMVVPPEVLAIGTPARVRGPLTASQRWWVTNNPAAYQRLARHYAQTSVEIDEPGAR